jgi:outer membrane protein
MKFTNFLSKTLVYFLLFFGLFFHTIVQADWSVRAGMTSWQPNDKSSKPTIFSSTPIEETGISIDSDNQAGISFTRPLNNSFALEIAVVAPYSHTISSTGEFATLFGDELITVKQLSCTLSTLYYPFDFKIIRPYLGLGFNYADFHSEKLAGDLQKADDIFREISVGDTFAPVAQLGFDVSLNENWFINISAQYVKSKTTIKISSNETIDITSDLELNPSIYSVALGYRF